MMLYCYTCTLVFYQDCVQPRLNEVPLDDWSCAYCLEECIVEVETDGDEYQNAVKACSEMDLSKV